MNWVDLEGKEYTDIAHFGNAYGFIYIIEHKENGWFYIGKKNLEFNRKKKLQKKNLFYWKLNQEDDQHQNV